MDIGPGDWVECVDVSFNVKDRRRIACGWDLEDTISRDLSIGAIYLVSETGVDPEDSELLLRLVGIVARTESGWFAGFRFRPVYRPKQEIIESLKAPPQRVREDA